MHQVGIRKITFLVLRARNVNSWAILDGIEGDAVKPSNNFALWTLDQVIWV